MPRWASSKLCEITPRATLIAQYHHDTGIANGLSLAHAQRIADDCGLTVLEIALSVGASVADAKRWILAAKRFPPYMALHFKMLHATITDAPPMIPYHLFPRATLPGHDHHD